MTSSHWAKLGAAFYFIWGLLHIKAAWIVYQMGENLPADMIQGRLFQSGWNLLFFALAAMAIAVFYNWKNDRQGYWANLIMVSATDIGFILFILVPGHLALWPGIMGPVFWVLALIASTMALKQNDS
ncbi:hypothetical protein SG34_018345 [Thalassomonas viridans]|uniref:Uncharacterized protein n=1 Tax=Thalassomonas viridans TaxID=137584 RepID=A0AAE9YZC0_9GAMM|nr:hypothetical protein [Thalassomonas viridans]WDE03352.1 hypothetical protein SG34_018345 [Thalassomonas viridans]